MSLDDLDNPLAVEIRQEMASAYFVACKKMVDALAALKAFAGNEQSQHRMELLEAAAERVYFVVIQREAMKLSCFEDFFEAYEVPTEVRERLRPRKRVADHGSSTPMR